MGVYASDIKFAVLTFPILAFLISLPYALWQYRRFGSVSVWKTFVVFAFAFYALCACYLVVLPLPADHSAVVPGAKTPQLNPMHLITSIREAVDFSFNDRSTWLPTLKSPVVYEAIFNVMLTMPLGAFLHYLFRLRWFNVLLIGFATTLLFEVSQLTGLFGIYEYPYRLFDVDDLILNTFGCMLGFWLAIPACWTLPHIDDVDGRSYERGAAQVTPLRRLAGFTVDAIVMVALFAFSWLWLSPSNRDIAVALALDPSKAGALGFIEGLLLGLKADPAGALVLLALCGLVAFVAVPAITRGRTLGHTLVGLRIVDAQGAPASPLQCLVRYGMLGLFLLAPAWLVLFVPDEVEGVTSTSVIEMVVLVYGVWVLLLFVRAFASVAGVPFMMLNELASSTRLVPSNAVAQAGQPPRGGFAGAPTPGGFTERSGQPVQPGQQSQLSQQDRLIPVPQPGFAEVPQFVSDSVDETQEWQPVRQMNNPRHAAPRGSHAAVPGNLRNSARNRAE